MKINYISSSTIPSSEANAVHVMKMSQAIAKEGIRLSLFSRTNKSNTSVINDYNKYGVENCFKMKKIKVPGIKYLNNIYYSLKILLFLIKEEIRNNDSDPVYYGRDLLALALISLFKRNVYYEAHSPPNKFSTNLLIKFLFRRKNFKGLVVISKALKDEFINRYDIHFPVSILHDGADIVEVENNHEVQDKVRIGYTGSIYKGRGIELIVAMAKRLPEYTFSIIGGTREQIINLYEGKISLPKNLEIVGRVEPREIPHWLEKMSVVLAPYQKKVSVANSQIDTSKWMSPLKVFEYMASGKAIICSDLLVLKEVLIDYHNCLLVDPESVDDWIDAINELATNQRLRKSLGNQARIDLKQKYSWSIRAKKLKEFLTENSTH